MNTIEADLFEVIQNEVGCQYISDLHYGDYRQQAIYAMRKQELSGFPLPILEDMANYLFNETVHFTNYEEAQLYFLKHE